MNYRMKQVTGLVIAMVAATAVGVASAGTYRWVDQDGKPHYSDTPVQGAQPVTVKAPGVTAGSSGAASSQEPGKEQAAKDQAPKDAASVRAEQCTQATARLKTYRDSASLIQKDEYGREHEIAGEERVSLIVKTQRDVKDFCGETQAAQ